MRDPGKKTGPAGVSGAIRIPDRTEGVRSMTNPNAIPPKHATAARLLGVIELVGCRESARQAREYVREKLGSDHPALGDVTLLVSELVANSVVHSESKNGGKVTLAIADCFDRIHVDVVDAGGKTAPQVSARASGDMAESGRGLMFVDMLSDRWDVYEHDTGQRTVWFQVKYQREGTGDVPSCPRQRKPVEPMEHHQGAVRRTAKQAARTVGESVELERQQRHARQLIDRWGLDREGLDHAATSLGVPALGDEEVTP